MSPVRRFWPVLAVATGALLVYFELTRPGEVGGENIVWIIVGGLIVVLGVIDLIQKALGRGEDEDARPRKML